MVKTVNFSTNCLGHRVVQYWSLIRQLYSSGRRFFSHTWRMNMWGSSWFVFITLCGDVMRIDNFVYQSNKMCHLTCPWVFYIILSSVPRICSLRSLHYIQPFCAGTLWRYYRPSSENTFRRLICIFWLVLRPDVNDELYVTCVLKTIVFNGFLFEWCYD